MELEKLLQKIAKIFDKLDILYCVTGGYAVSVWGRPRATFHLDVLIKLKTEELPVLARSLRALSKAGYLDEITAQQAIRCGGEFNYIHPESGMKIDFWVLGQDLITLNELKRRVPKKIGHQTVYFISPEDLILAKLRWHKKSGSDRQLDDVASIIKMQKIKLDVPYLKSKAKKQTVVKYLNKLLKTK